VSDYTKPRDCGKYDKNGTIICEGDLVQHHNVNSITKPEYWNPIYVVRWDPPCFVLQYVGGGKQAGNAAFILRHYPSKLEVISKATENVKKEEQSFDALVLKAKAEAERAMQKFPQPNYVISKLAEEAGEVVKAAIHCAEGREDPVQVRDEIVQLLAMVYRLWIEGDEVHGLSALEKHFKKDI
jgi:NTP pyrophosphatase (non-canonical NTP hydrolase)